jgi:hypothetical protein
MKRLAWLLLALTIVAAGRSVGAALPEAAHFDGSGRLSLMAMSGDPVALGGEIRVAGPAWAFYGASTPWSATGVTFAVESNGVSVWTGCIPLDNGGRARYEQRVRPLSNGADVSLMVTALTDLTIDSISYCVQFPVTVFSEAQLVLWRGIATVAEIQAPAVYQPGNEPRFLVAAAVDRVSVRADPRRIGIALDRPRSATFQDDRKWGTGAYSLLIPFGKGPLMRRGETARMQVAITLAGEPDREPVRIEVNSASPGDRFDGFGGNFVYGLESPVATTLVARLAPVRARIEMALHEWEPENDNASPDEADWTRFEACDTAGSGLRRGFELAALLAKRGVPLCISVWDLPEWMVEGPRRNRWASRRTVAPGLWPDVLESAGTYLVHLKKRYGVEPELFSFNEPEAGVRVLFTAEQHREMIRRFGERFAALGLKTKILLADVSTPRGTESYGVFALSDPVCRPYIGAVACHSWGGATPREYAAWPALARRFDLPLDITELGWDPGTWRTPHELKTPLYAVQELKMILETLAYARPRSALLWEYSDDYPLLMTQRGQDGRESLADTPRLRFLEQLINRTPRPALALEVSTSRTDVPACSFATDRPGNKPAFVLHLANTGAARKAVISGLPEAMTSLQSTSLAATDKTAVEARVPVKAGLAELELPAWSLVSLSAADP